MMLELPPLAFLEFAILTILVLVFPAVSLSRTLHIIMVKTLIFPRLGPMSPKVLTLLALRWAVTIKAEAVASLHVQAGETILDIEICRTLP